MGETVGKRVGALVGTELVGTELVGTSVCVGASVILVSFGVGAAVDTVILDTGSGMDVSFFVTVGGFVGMRVGATEVGLMVGCFEGENVG